MPPNRPNKQNKLDFLKKPRLHLNLQKTKHTIKEQTFNMSDIGKLGRLPGIQQAKSYK